MLPYLRLPITLFFLVFIPIQITAQDDEYSGPPFRFTRSIYNASIPENSFGKTYVTSDVKMGVFDDELDDGVERQRRRRREDLKGSIVYNIIEGDPDRLFKAEARRVGDFTFLQIRTRSSRHAAINREQKDVYNLVVKATERQGRQSRYGNKRAGRCDVIVHVTDVNDLSPLFDPVTYRADVPENAPVHYEVIRVHASDADIGINGEILYGLSEPSDVFALHPTTGVVTLTRQLDYNERSSYSLEVHARDRAPSLEGTVRVSKASLTINVVEVNQYSPVIELRELPQVVEHGMVGTVYAVIYVTDKDRGRNGKIDSVRVTAGDPAGFFQLVRKAEGEYLLQVGKQLDREVYPDGFNITVSASDQGQPPRSAEVVIRVELQDTNDHAPLFISSDFNVTISECLPPYSNFLRLVSSDLDDGLNAQATYRIINSPTFNPFVINSESGMLSIRPGAQLDAETTKIHRLTVEAVDRANNGSKKTTKATVVINVGDCNDNAPVFSAMPGIVYLDENLPIGQTVYTIEASDADSGENSFISYSLTNIDDVPFAIDHFTGKIYTTEVLDYETGRRDYTLVVRGADWGAPYRRETDVRLKIKVKDVNDNRPRFERVDCSGYIVQGAPVNSEIVTVSAVDMDARDVVSYRLTAGNEDSCFEMDATSGQLRTKCDFVPTRREIQRNLTVVSIDGVHTSEPMQVRVSILPSHTSGEMIKFTCKDTDVLDELNAALKEAEMKNKDGADGTTSWPDSPNYFTANLHAPVFGASNPSQLSIREDLKQGELILHLNATDEDHGYNSLLMFVISSGNIGDVFDIEPYSGNLTIAAGISVDRETVSEYKLEITVYDTGSPRLSATSSLHITLQDVNDNAPKFEQTSYKTTIKENTAPGASVIKVKATDEDLGANGRVVYSLGLVSESFDIDEVTGELSIKRSPDRESQSRHELVVIATDRSPDTPLSSMVTVTIVIEDINDNPPVFLTTVGEAGSMTVRIPEDIPSGAVIHTVYARDPDQGLNGEIRYSIPQIDPSTSRGESASQDFTIDPFTGAIRLARAVSFERQRLYNITVSARDRGSPSLQAISYVLVEVLDVNGNLFTPEFSDIVFEGHIRENQPPRTSVLQVQAKDLDSERADSTPADYDIVYSIRDGSGLGRFYIDNRGIIYTKEPLDREQNSHFWLTVYAQDSGPVPRSSFVEVYIEVEDLNDNPPQTNEPIYFPELPEGSPEGSSVIKLEGMDLDPSASSEIVFEITGGNPQGFFQIDRITGLITTTQRTLDREKQDEHILEVTLSDNGLPSLSSTTRVVVTVKDINDETPTFLDRYRVAAPRLPQRLLHLPLLRVIASDLDAPGQNSDIEYSISQTAREGSTESEGREGQFYINSTSGAIHARREISGKESQIVLQVTATDRGYPSLSSNTRVFLSFVDLSARSSGAPRFDHHPSVTVMENDPVGQMVCLLSASDPEGDSVWYYIIGGNIEDTFSINSQYGNVLLAKPLDRERLASYNLTVMATDGFNQGYTTVYISVRDINDNTPRFIQSSYHVNVSEQVTAGSEIFTLSATDADESKRLFFTLHSSANPDSLAMFHINSETGVLSTTTALNHEAISRHELTIMARDQGTPSRRTLARVVVNVQDHNDHPPEFVLGGAEGFEARVYSTAPPGTSVIQVMGVDRDKGLNAKITYSLDMDGDGGFRIDPSLGIITVADKLNLPGHGASYYSLRVRATDQGRPPLSSTTLVRIIPTLASNAPPLFDQLEYIVETPENLPIGAYITHVRALSQSSVTYRLVEDELKGLFALDPSSGVILADTVFDYETRSFYNLTLRATNIAGATTHATLLVHILDVNDNAPSFLSNSYYGNISESSPAGSYVLDSSNAPLVVKAVDGDGGPAEKGGRSGSNSLLEYSIVEAGAAEMFSIESSTGALRSKVVLDREVQPVYEFHVQVRDLGTPSLTAIVAAQVTIYINDINDTPPKFTSDLFQATLLLPTYADVSLVELKAFDADSVDSTTLEYSLVSGEGLDKFSLDKKTGVLVVKDITDLLDQYEFDAKVSDGKFENHCTVKIQVDFRQSTGLRFSSALYEASVEENRTLNADLDLVVTQAQGHDLNEHLTFTLLNSRGMFGIRSTSGVVYCTGKPFDREIREHYILVAEVRDNRTPQRVAHTLINITITDINDNVPIFVGQPYYVVTAVKTTPGDVIKKLTAVDHDIGDNGVIDYSLIEGDEMFGVRKNTGEIYVRGALATLPPNQRHRIVVEAQDRGEIPLSARVEVFITVRDEATPLFEQPFYSVGVLESVPLFSTVVALQASSPTSGKLIYSITEGDTKGEFSVDFNTDMAIVSPCAILVIEPLDYETTKRYELTIRATDIHSGSYADTILYINVEDVNDHSPVFQSTHYTASISEAVSVGTSVLNVLANDLDSGFNAKVRYRLEPLPGSVSDVSFFSIDQESGLVSVRNRLDHEQSSSLSFTVIALDMGSLQGRSSSTIVTIIVTDLNDNAPRFDRPSYTASISDRAERGQVVTAVHAFDPDTSDRTRLAYSLISGGDDLFAVNSTTGVVSVTTRKRVVKLSAGVKDLNVSVSDGVFVGYTRVRVTVVGSNLAAPVFSRGMYEVGVRENLPPGQIVVVVNASDLDAGDFGSVRYALRPDEKTNERFRIDHVTGKITTSMELDRELSPYHLLHVTATDGGGNIGHAKVKVNVLDMDDEPPRFYLNDYKVNMYATAALGSNVAQVMASDRDIGVNADFTYSLVTDAATSDTTGYFNINPNTGVITTAASLTQLENDLLQFFVRAQNVGGPLLHSDVSVQVYLMSPLDRPPAFPHSSYAFFVREDQPIRTAIAQVLANGSTGSLKYSLVIGHEAKANFPVKFTVDSTNGTLRIAGVDGEGVGLDRETTPIFELTVRAETLTSPPLVAHTHITVQVLDVNDNAPQFESEIFHGTVIENLSPGVKILQVVATDTDEGPNSDISYLLSPTNSREIFDKFSLDATTGIIKTLQPLDRESINEYRFTVVANDAGSPRQLLSTATVVVKVIDENDEPPVFSEQRYNGAVNEDALPGTIILVLSTIDKDEAPYNTATYHVGGGDPLGQFSIRRNGELYVNRALDREEKDFYNLTVLATDGAFVAKSFVHIAILDANDNAPVCDKDTYEISVAENVAIGSVLLRVTAQDADESGTRNSRVEYELDPVSARTFNINQRTGYITTRVALDRETAPQYRLSVTALDGGGLSCVSHVNIALSDINDNPPRFLQPHYLVTAPENTDRVTLVARVTAVDPDLGLNRKVEYSLTHTDQALREIFTIDPVSGVITLHKSLDREKQDSYNLTLVATDSGSPRLSSTAQLTLMILDLNDNPPEFERTLYQWLIPESAPLGSLVGSVYATSLDAGVNAEITYSIISTANTSFVINSTTGVVIISEPLDFEQVTEYVLTIEARDGGQPPLSATTIVVINVTDVNDNVPMFLEPEYRVNVREDVTLNTNLIKHQWMQSHSVEAVDRDSGEGGMVEYRLVGGDERDQFIVDPKNGRLLVSSSLDREKISSYHLIISATDKGVPQLSSTVNVTVQLLDVNDVAPKFLNRNFTTAVQADAPLGTTVFKLVVADNDLDPNGPPFTFELLAGSNHDFVVDRHGRIRTSTTVFNRKTKDKYQLRVRVTDNGTPPLYSDVNVTVVIAEESHSPPVLTTPSSVRVMSVGEVFQGGVIYKVKAVDPDPYDKLVFSLPAPTTPQQKPLFAIHPTDGTLRTIETLDPGQYVIPVNVTDGRFYAVGEVRLTIEAVSSDMIDSAVVLRFESVAPDEFVSGGYLKNLMGALGEEMGVREDDVKIITVQPASDEVAEPGGRSSRNRRQAPGSKTTPSSNLDVLTAVQKSPNKYFASRQLKRRIDQATDVISVQAGVKLIRVSGGVCARDSCNSAGECKTTYLFKQDEAQSLMGEGGSIVSVPYTLSYECSCRVGYAGLTCKEKVEIGVCTPGLCPEPMVCHSDGQAYTCRCPEGRGGEDCLDIIEPPCLDLACRKDKPITFSGHSYVRWRLTVSMERRLSLALEIKTVQPKARLMHAVGRIDYSILEIEDGMVQFRFDCGSGQGLARVESLRVSDGLWHEIVVERIRQNVRITIDGTHVADGTAPGIHDVLNLDGSDVYFGAEVETLAHGFEDIQTGFVGCMSKIRIDGVDMPVVGSTSVAVLQHMQDIEFHCRGSYIPGICSSGPCRNGGSCLSMGPDSFLCQCTGRFLGPFCEQDTNPCASDPCLNNGVCKNLLNDYKCTCQGRLKGKRCELSSFCESNPCRHGAKCISGATSAICQCLPGFYGSSCESDIDECRSSPCTNGGTCHNLHGSFFCNCSAPYAGELCEATGGQKLVKSSIAVEIIGIIIAVAACVVLALVLVFSIRYCRRRHQRNQRLRHSKEQEEIIYGGECLKKLNRQSGASCNSNEHNGDIGDYHIRPFENGTRSSHHNGFLENFGGRNPSPKPPRIPRRPASYTPSAADSVNTLNIGDMVRNYGTAGEDLEYPSNRRDLDGDPKCEPIVIPEFLQNVEDLEAAAATPKSPRKYPSSPHSSRESAPLLDGLNNLNKAENYHKNPRTLSKIIPSVNASTQSLELLQTGTRGGSVTSLPISDLDDDTQGYHWDTSDWNPGLANLPADDTVPGNRHSGDSNNLYLPSPGQHISALDTEGYESEYVGDSEFLDDTDDPYADDDVKAAARDYSSSLDFQKILAMRNDLDFGTDVDPITDLDDNDDDDEDDRHAGYSESGQARNLRDYLPPMLDVSRGSGLDDVDMPPIQYGTYPRHDPHSSGTPGSGSGGALNGNFSSADFISRDDDADVIRYGFPPLILRGDGRAIHGAAVPGLGEHRPDSRTDTDIGGMSHLDNMSAVSGPVDTMSEISGLCEIEDSEACSDEDDDEGMKGLLGVATRTTTTAL